MSDPVVVDDQDVATVVAGVDDVPQQQDDAPAKRGRGRPRGSKSRSSSRKPAKAKPAAPAAAMAGVAENAFPTLTPAFIEEILSAGLAMGASATGDWRLAELQRQGHARQLAQAVHRLVTFYDVSVSEEAQVWGGVAVASLSLVFAYKALPEHPPGQVPANGATGQQAPAEAAA